jgi:multidrug resistance efflux pump
METNEPTDLRAAMAQASAAWNEVQSWKAQARANLEEAQRLYEDALKAEAEARPTYETVKANYERWRAEVERIAGQSLEAEAPAPQPIGAPDSSVDARLRNLEASLGTILTLLQQKRA